MFRRYFKPTIYVLLILIPALIVFFNIKSPGVNVVLELSKAPLNAFDSIGKTIKKFIFAPVIYDQYVLAKRERDILKANLVSLQEDIKKNGRLEDINALRKQRSFVSVVADVIGRDPSNWNASLIINKGKKHGVAVGMPVITHLGAVGKIIDIGPTTAKVILLSDPNFSLAAVVMRTRESGLLTGSLQGLCRLKYLSHKADVKVGDEVVSSNLSTAFPEGILIGKVVEVQASENRFSAECLIEPAVNLSTIEEVIVIKN